MSKNKISIKDIAYLSRIPIDDAESASLFRDFAAILSYMADVRALPLENVPETARVTDEVNVWREDVVEPSLSQAEALQNGKTRDGYFEASGVLGWHR